MAAHNELGTWGEGIAYEYLRHGGYRILHRNWQFGHRDLDIVAIENDVLVIVEVKTRRNEAYMDADLAVNVQKIRSLAIAANAYIKSECLDNEVRFDIITIVGTPEKYELRHTKDAFLPMR